MLERRAVSKIYVSLPAVFVLASTLVFSSFETSYAEVRQPAAKSKKKQSKKTNEKSKTIGDILKKIEKKSEKVSFQKKGNNLPQFAAAEKQATKVNLREVKPPESKKLYYEEGTDEAELERVTDEGISALYNLAKQYSKSSKRGELWLRLAEQYVEKARLIEFRLLNKNDQQMALFQQGKLKKRPTLDLSPAMEYNKKAIQLYEWFLRDFPKDPKVDQALFFLGFNYFEINETKKGESYYLRLTKEFPDSLYVSESNFALGEYHFEGQRWKQALEYYQRVASQKNSRLFTFGLYKMAWCYYKMSQSKKGMTYLEAVIMEGRKSKAENKEINGGVSRIRLATEAIKDLIVFFAEAGDPNNARAYFEEVVGPKSANTNLAKLAYFYVDTGNRTGARLIFRDLISQDPNSVKSFDYQYAIVKMYSGSGDPGLFKQELYAWIDGYGPASSWQKINEDNKEVIGKANELMEGLLRTHTLQLHQTAQNSKTKTSQNAANAAYELYFNTFNKAAKIDEIHFFYGELLFDMEKYEKAAYHYQWVTEKEPSSQYFEKSLTNTLLALEKRLPTDEKIRKIVGDTTEPIEFGPEVKAFETAAYNYFEKAPKGENNVAAKYRLGALYYLFNQFDPAVKLFNEIIAKYPKTPFAKYSANHLLDIYNIKKDYVGLQSAADRILAVPDLARSEIGDQIKDIKLRTDFKLAKDLEDKKDYLSAAKAYESFASKNKASDLARGARFNAAVNYERAGDILSAISMYGLILAQKEKKPDNFAANAEKFLPILYEKTGNYEKAASAFESYAVANPKDALAEEYLFNAAVIYDGLNYFTAAIRNYEKYFDKRKKRDKVEALFLLAKIYQRKGQLDRAISYSDKYLNSGTPNSSAVVETVFTIATLHEKLGRKKVAEEWYGKTIGTQATYAARGKNVGARYAAEAKLKLVSKLYDDLTAIRIPQNPKNQERAVKDKAFIISKLKEKLKAVIAYDDGFQIVGALTLQGRALEHMYFALLDAPAPSGLTGDLLKQYKEQVKTQLAEPNRVQAIELYKAAIDKGLELQAYCPAMVTAQRNYARLKGEKGAEGKAILTQVPDWRGL